MDEAGERGQGIFASLRRLVGTVLTIVHNRLEMLLVELDEARWRFIGALLLAGLVLILALMALLVPTLAIVVLCLKANRLDLVVVLTLLYLAATLVGLWRLHHRLKNWVPFSATLAELRKDKACLDEKS
jgi:uncharacterized membrane protein YqjE